ncbi:MAG: hypothetical protein ACJA13_001211 [Paraglaciecola sp.]|jgi:hypothetical protein
MKTHIIKTTFYCTFILGLTGCAFGQKPCEDIIEVNHQQQQCLQWKKVMGNDEYPQQALTARKHFEQACLNLRYYRDDYDTICKGNDSPIGEQ